MAPIFPAMVRCAGGGIIRSSVVTRYQLGLLRQAASVTAAAGASTLHGTCASAMNAARPSGRSPANGFVELAAVQQQEAVLGRQDRRLGPVGRGGRGRGCAVAGSLDRGRARVRRPAPAVRPDRAAGGRPRRLPVGSRRRRLTQRHLDRLAAADAEALLDASGYRLPPAAGPDGGADGQLGCRHPRRGRGQAAGRRAPRGALDGSRRRGRVSHRRDPGRPGLGRTGGGASRAGRDVGRDQT